MNRIVPNGSQPFRGTVPNGSPVPPYRGTGNCSLDRRCSGTVQGRRQQQRDEKLEQVRQAREALRSMLTPEGGR